MFTIFIACYYARFRHKLRLDIVHAPTEFYKLVVKLCLNSVLLFVVSDILTTYLTTNLLSNSYFVSVRKIH